MNEKRNGTISTGRKNESNMKKKKTRKNESYMTADEMKEQRKLATDEYV